MAQIADGTGEMAVAGMMVVESLDSEGMVFVKAMVVGPLESEKGMLSVRGMAAGPPEPEKIKFVRELAGLPEPEGMESEKVMVVGSPELEGLLLVRGTVAGQSEFEVMESSAVHHSVDSSLSLVGARHCSFDNTCVLPFN